MAQARMINRRIAKSDKFAALLFDRSRVLYFMVYPHLDVKGRYSGDPLDIKEDCCPRLKYSIKQIAESVIDLHNVGLLVLYEIEQRPYIEFSRFEDFQSGIREDREAPSLIPDYSGLTPDDIRRTPSLYLNLYLSLKLIYPPSFPTTNAPRKKKKESETEIEKEFVEFWRVYPRRVARLEALKAFIALRKTISLADIASATNGYNAVIRKKQTDIQYVMYPATFLCNEKWKDFVGVTYKAPL